MVRRDALGARGGEVGGAADEGVQVRLKTPSQLQHFGALFLDREELRGVPWGRAESKQFQSAEYGGGRYWR
eukprot:178768-Rhodomonas_salina.1